MTRKTEGVNSVAGTRPGNLRTLRSQIDKLDLQILKLVNERAEIAAEIGKHKADDGSEVFSPAREEEVIANVIEANKGPLSETTVRAAFREIISGSRALQRVLKVAYLGPEYSFSHLAGIEKYGQSVELMPVDSIATVFDNVSRNQVDLGVVPLENSTDGRIADTLEMFLLLPHLLICAEIRLRIHHNLLCNCEQAEIRHIYSKPQALSQCRNWLAKTIPHARLIPVASTGTAAELAEHEKGAAAVASREAAVRYGLRILFADIEDNPFNETRFAVISHHKCERTGTDKTCVVFRVEHSPGALGLEALDIFKQNKINLTWIESFPARTPKPEYVFFVDFEGHREDPKVKRALQALEATCLEVIILGSFPRAELSS